MNNLGAFGLLAIAVVIAALFVLVGAIPILVARNLITRKPVAAHLKEWLLYVLGATLLILAFAVSHLYADHRGIDKHVIIKWMNILMTAIFVFGSAIRKFWSLHKKWTFWATLGALIVSHFALLSRLHWEQSGYFWLMLIFGLLELAVVYFLLGLMFDQHENLTGADSA